ncbi:MAG: DUF3180 domain-containing protein [Rhodoluna sp.]|nr:DUF3180 domain-containing protein [Rhodoluna sp.]MBP6186731.1 DUF3180 domain-containing protein [Rhodoluna sp.]
MPTVVSWSVVYVLVRLMLQNGASIPIATNTVLITLPSIAIIELAIAIPVFKYRSELQKFATSGVRPKRLDPFYAMRVVVLAKATSIAGALFLGTAIGLVFMQLSQPVIADSIWRNLVALVESVVLIAVALFIEKACKLPDDGENSGKAKESSSIEANPA